MSFLMNHLLFSYLRKDVDWSKPEDGCWKMAITEPVPKDALVVPFAITDAKQWWMGWYRGKDDKGFDLVESVETHEICKFSNTGFLFLTNVEFSDNPAYHYSDREYDLIDRIKKRCARNNYWFVVGHPKFNDDGSIDIPIRKKFTDEWYTKTYRNFREVTIAALDKHCEECNNISKDKTV